MLTSNWVATNLEKPGIVGEFSEPGKLMELSRNSVQSQRKNVTNKTRNRKRRRAAAKPATCAKNRPRNDL